MLESLMTLSFPRLRAEALRRAGTKAGIQALSGVSGCPPVRA